MTNRRRETQDVPRTLGGSARDRRGAGGLEVGQGLAFDASGRPVWLLPDGFYFDDRGRPQMRESDTFGLTAHSPRAPTVKIDRRSIRVTAQGMVATPELADVTGTIEGIDATTLLGILLRLQANKLNVLDFVATLGALIQEGTATLVAGDSGAIASTLVSSTNPPQFWRRTPGTSAGHLYADPADIVDGVSFKVKSTDALDDADVYWRVGP